MTRRLFLFNPENDSALVSDADSYTAPPLPRRLRTDLAVLPLWLADNDDVVCVSDIDATRGYQDFASANLGLEAKCVEQCPQGGDFRFVLWGWSRAVKKELCRYGFTKLPDNKQLEKLRQLSSRATSVRLLEMLSDAGLDVPPIPKICQTKEDVTSAVAAFRNAVLKQPWSSSGRGVIAVDLDNLTTYESFAKGTLRRQKYVVCEKMLDKVQDFAMEFFCSERGVEFVGYSVFYNNAVMSYDHATVASTDTLRQHLLRYTDAETLQRIQTEVATCLQEILPDFYYGYVGVDMMAYRNVNGEMLINPCVEMNLRTTMGVISSVLGNRYLAPGKTARMDVLYHRTEAEVQDYIAALQSPAFVDKRLASGTLVLAPVNEETRFTATLTVTSF